MEYRLEGVGKLEGDEQSLREQGIFVIGDRYFRTAPLRHISCKALEEPDWTQEHAGFEMWDVIQVEHNEYEGNREVVKVSHAIVTWVHHEALQFAKLLSYSELVTKLAYERGETLSDFVQALSLDTTETVFESVPQCFNQTCIKWRSINGIPPPTEKGSFIWVRSFSTPQHNEPGARMRKVGKLARRADIEIFEAIPMESTRIYEAHRNAQLEELARAELAEAKQDVAHKPTGTEQSD